MGIRNIEFNNLHDWIDFKNYLITINRFVLDENHQNFIQTIINIAERKKILLKQGDVWYRARRQVLNHSVKPLIKVDKQIYGKFPANKEDVYAPPIELTQEGRANPRRLPMLYLAEDEITAMTEVRPYLSEQLTCALFKIDWDLKVVDLRAQPFDSDLRNNRYNRQSKGEITPQELEDHIWEDIGHDFSRPTDPNDTKAIYVPTQYLAATFRSVGFDGIIYSSSLREEGKNLVLFDKNAARPYVGKIYVTKKIEFDFTLSGEPVEYE